MADYELRYSGEEIDAICDKVTGMNFTANDINGLMSRTGPLNMYWGWYSFKAEIKERDTAYHYSHTFLDILPDGAADRKDIFVMVSCDFGGEVFDTASTSYKVNGKNVEAEFLISPGGRWANTANELGTYTMNAYCLVIYLTEGGWHVG